MTKTELLLSRRFVEEPQEKFFYSWSGEDEVMGCIGHLRGDFGREGREFWTTWFDHCSELNIKPFKKEFDLFINLLRDGKNILSDLQHMRAECYKYPQSPIKSASEGTYGFKYTSDDYVYFLRCWTGMGDDYNFYCYCYSKPIWEKYIQDHQLT